MNGSPTCTVGPLLGSPVVELGRGHRRAVDAVAPGLRADVEHRVADAAGARRRRCRSPSTTPSAEGVDEDVAVVGRVEVDLAADGGDADAVAVAADARDHASSSSRVRGCIGRAEAQRVEQRDGPRAHREDVAQDAADARGRALVRLDEGRMVVRLDLEDRAPARRRCRRRRRSRPVPAATCGPVVGKRPQVQTRALVASSAPTTSR